MVTPLLPTGQVGVVRRAEGRKGERTTWAKARWTHEQRPGKVSLRPELCSQPRAADLGGVGGRAGSGEKPSVSSAPSAGASQYLAQDPEPKGESRGAPCAQPCTAASGNSTY